MKQITFNSNNFYAIIAYIKGTVIYEFSSKKEQEDFVKKGQDSAEGVYEISLEEAKFFIQSKLNEIDK